MTSHSSRWADTEPRPFCRRLQYGFKLSQLILNVNITLKSIKHLLALFKAADFELLVEPKVQGPKRFHNIQFRCASLCFEAQDDPMETSTCRPSGSFISAETYI